MENQLFSNESNKENTDMQLTERISAKNKQNNQNYTEKKSLNSINISKMVDSEDE
jgi:hypothetical protein